MSEPDIIEETQQDLERGDTLQSTANGGIEPPLNERREITHTDKELLERAREVNSSGKFIFTCFSEMNTFLLLRSQQQILKLQNKLHDSVEGNGTWTDADSDDLQTKLNQYRTVQQYFSTNCRLGFRNAENNLDLGPSSL